MQQYPAVRGYALAALALLIATLSRWLLDPHLGDHAPFPTYFAAVTFVGIYGGLGPAIATVIAGGLLADLLFLPPRGMVLLVGPTDWPALLLFALGSGLIVAVTEWFRATNANLAAIVSTAHEGIVTCSLDGTVTGWNAGAQRMYDYSRDEMVGTPCERLLPPSRRGETRWIIDEVKAGRPVEALETERVRRDGRHIDVLVSAAPVRDNRGRVRSVATIERDVTESKRVERARRTTEARLQAIIDNAPLIVFVKDLEGRYFLVNRSYLELFGTTVEAVLGSTDFDRFPAETAAQYRRNDAAVMASGTAQTFEELADRPAGATRTFLSTKFPLRDDHGEIYAICGISTDVTEETRRHEQLVDLDRRKDQFLSMLAHELRNPLAPIVNAVQLIRLQDGTSERVAWASGVIERQARHLTRMVDDLLDIARFNTGRVQLRRETVDMVALARQVVEDLQSRFDDAGVSLEVSLPDEPIMVDADAARIVQVLDNLLDNAAKYTDSGGSAVLTVERQNHQCVLRICDTGIGIDAVHLSHVFDLFEQVDESLDRASGGLGLGLNLVKRMVELHGGSVAARSEGRGRGSTFTVCLPLSEGTRRETPVARMLAASPQQRRRVLVIEDNPDTAQSMEMLLDILGHKVQVARTGAEGLALAAAQRPELVLVDLGLPDIDGYQVARSLRERFGPALRLVAVTGYGQQEHRRRTSEAGFDEHLLKPLTLEILDQALAACAV